MGGAGAPRRRRRSYREEAVDERDGEKEGLVEEGELAVDQDQPVHEDAPHLVVDVRLSAHVARVWLCLHLVWGKGVGGGRCVCVCVGTCYRECTCTHQYKCMVVCLCI